MLARLGALRPSVNCEDLVLSAVDGGWMMVVRDLCVEYIIIIIRPPDVMVCGLKIISSIHLFYIFS